MRAMKPDRRHFLIGFAALAVAAACAAPAAHADGDAAAFIDQLGRQATALAGDKSLDIGTRTEKLRLLLDRGFDGAAIGRFVLGKYWRSASEAERAEFITLFRDFTAVSYARRFDAYRGETLTILGSSVQAGEGPPTAVVRSRLSRADGSVVRVDWRVRQTADGWRVYDVVVEGISMLLTQRSEFGAVIQRSGGLDGLLQQLRRRSAESAANAASG
jgi:phospholipid transport system substrate-binding protein